MDTTGVDRGSAPPITHRKNIDVSCVYKRTTSKTGIVSFQTVDQQLLAYQQKLDHYGLSRLTTQLNVRLKLNLSSTVYPPLKTQRPETNPTNYSGGPIPTLTTYKQSTRS